MPTMEERLTSLERSARLWRMGALGLSFALVASLLMGTAQPVQSGTDLEEVRRWAAGVQRALATTTLDSLRVKRLEVVNDEGRTIVLAAADASKHGILEVWNRDSRGRALVGHYPDGLPLIGLEDGGHHLRAGLFATDVGGSLELYDGPTTELRNCAMFLHADERSVNLGVKLKDSLMHSVAMYSEKLGPGPEYVSVKADSNSRYGRQHAVPVSPRQKP